MFDVTATLQAVSGEPLLVAMVYGHIGGSRARPVAVLLSAMWVQQSVPRRCGGVRTIPLWVAIVGVLAVVSCAEAGVDELVGRACLDDFGCAVGQVCQAGVCVDDSANNNAANNNNDSTANNNAANNNVGGGGSANNNAGGGQNNNTSTFQQQAVENGQIQYADGTGIRITETLAIDVSGLRPGLPAPRSPLPRGFEPAPFYGAVDPAASTGWWQEWTYRDDKVDGNIGANFHPLRSEIEAGVIAAAATNQCQSIDPAYQDGGLVDVFGFPFPVCIVDSVRIQDDVAWPNDHVFLLSGTVNVGTGDVQLNGRLPSRQVTLTIQPGTQVYAASGADTSLVITRGSRLEASGTEALPIVFGAVSANLRARPAIFGIVTDLSERGQWGGIVLSGLGLQNGANSDGEAISDLTALGQERWFGGFDDEDDSGTLRYVIIAEAGGALGPDVESQSLTLEAVGRRTSVEYIQSIGCEGDCIEWFGGSMNMKYVLCQGFDDDGLDIDIGFRGIIQFAILVFGLENGDRGIESDNRGSDFDAEPFSAADLSNVTILGGPGGPANETVAALHREGYRGRVYRSVYTDNLLTGAGFENGCLDIDDVLPVEIIYRDAVFNCTPGPLAFDFD